MIGEKLRKARLEKKLKQSDVASRIGCAPTSLTNWESGKVNPPLSTLESLCSIYDISALDLLDKRYSINDIYAIARKPVNDRSYEETIALSFSGDITGWVTEDITDPYETDILAAYRILNPNVKTLLRDILSGLLSNPSNRIDN